MMNRFQTLLSNFNVRRFTQVTAVCHDPHFADAAVKFGVLPPHYADVAELSSDEPQAPCAAVGAAAAAAAGAIHITTALDVNFLTTGDGVALATWAANLGGSNPDAIFVLHVFTDSISSAQACMVGRCRLTVSEPVLLLKAPVVSAISA
jgi:hypothetical protein